MHEALNLVAELNDSDLDWIIESGDEQQIIAGAMLLTEGQDSAFLFIVLEGLLGISVAAIPDHQLATLGPGELVGDISFLEDLPASASVIAVENSLVLTLSKQALLAKIKQDPAFAARLYRAFAILASRRLRERVGSLGRALQEQGRNAVEASQVERRMMELIANFKQFVNDADKEALKHDGMLPNPRYREIQRGFREFVAAVNVLIGDQASLSQVVKDSLGALLQREVLPYLLLTSTAERFYSKPRGYAGDFFTIDKIYRNQPDGKGRLGPLLDYCFLEEPPAKAVRNRRSLLLEEMRRSLRERAGERTYFTSLACGPAAELFDLFADLEDSDRVMATLVDIDPQALAFVSKRRNRTGLRNQLRLETGNLLYLATGRQKLSLVPQDLVYSVGLIDYFNDKFVIKLLNYVHSILAPGGRVILGNFHPRNSAKAFMDYVLEWRLIHRSEQDMNRLFEASAFARPCTNIRFEEEGVNLFAEGAKV